MEPESVFLKGWVLGYVANERNRSAVALIFFFISWKNYATFRVVI